MIAQFEFSADKEYRNQKKCRVFKVEYSDLRIDIDEMLCSIISQFKRYIKLISMYDENYISDNLEAIKIRVSEVLKEKLEDRNYYYETLQELETEIESFYKDFAATNEYKEQQRIRAKISDRRDRQKYYKSKIRETNKILDNINQNLEYLEKYRKS